MDNFETPHFYKKHLPAFAGLFSMIMGSIVLIGWLINSSALVQILPVWAPMQFNTALGFLLLGCSFYTKYQQKKRLSLFLAGLTFLLGSLSLSQYLGGWNLGLDELFWQHPITTRTSHPGRMSPMTALCFMLLSVVITRANLRTGAPKGFINFPICIFISLMTFTNLIGYLFGFEGTFAWQYYTQMAAHTSLSFFVISSFKLLHLAFQKKVFKTSISPFLISCSIFFFFVYLAQAVKQDHYRTSLRKLKSEARQYTQQANKLIDQKVLAFKRLSQRVGVLEANHQDFWQYDTSEYIQDFKYYYNFIYVDENDRLVWSSIKEGYRHLKEFNYQSLPSYQRTKLEAKKFEKVTFTDVFKFPVKRGNNEEVLFAMYPVFVKGKYRGLSIGIINKDVYFKQLHGSLNLKHYFIKIAANNGGHFYETNHPDNEETQELFAANSNVLNWQISVYNSIKLADENKDYLGEFILFLGMIISFLFGGGFFLFRNMERLKNRINSKLEQEQFIAQVNSATDVLNPNLQAKALGILDMILKLPWSDTEHSGGIFYENNGKLELLAARGLNELELTHDIKPINEYDGMELIKKEEYELHIPIRHEQELIGLMLIKCREEFSLDNYFFYELISNKIGKVLMSSRFHAEQERNKQLQMLRSMVTTYNHEINNPLTIALILAQKLQKREEFKDLKEVQSIIESMERIAEIVKNINDLQSSKDIRFENYSEDCEMLQLKKSS